MQPTPARQAISRCGWGSPIHSKMEAMWGSSAETSTSGLATGDLASRVMTESILGSQGGFAALSLPREVSRHVKIFDVQNFFLFATLILLWQFESS